MNIFDVSKVRFFSTGSQLYQFLIALPVILQVGEILNKVLNAKTEFRERGKLKKASRIELSVRRLAASALKGDVGSAASLLKMRAHAEKHH